MSYFTHYHVFAQTCSAAMSPVHFTTIELLLLIIIISIILIKKNLFCQRGKRHGFNVQSYKISKMKLNLLKLTVHQLIIII